MRHKASIPYNCIAARVLNDGVAVITNTLEGLADPTTYHVGTIAILDKNGNCYGDESGMNICLH